jgi:hypothetical protein
MRTGMKQPGSSQTTATTVAARCSRGTFHSFDPVGFAIFAIPTMRGGEKASMPVVNTSVIVNGLVGMVALKVGNTVPGAFHICEPINVPPPTM